MTTRLDLATLLSALAVAAAPAVIMAASLWQDRRRWRAAARAEDTSNG